MEDGRRFQNFGNDQLACTAAGTRRLRDYVTAVPRLCILSCTCRGGASKNGRCLHM
jgi:hypothetical protein